MSQALRAVTRPGLTATEAIAWWQTAPHDNARPRTPVGFGFSAEHAHWWRVIDGMPSTPQGAADLTGVYELVGFDGELELRWRNDDDGRGAAVVLAGTAELLPPEGRDVSPATATPLQDPQPRVLAGQVRRVDGAPGWVRLTAARYAPVEIPLQEEISLDLAGKGKNTPVLVLDTVEYTEQDQHGNVCVVDRRLIRLRLVRQEELRLDLTKEN